MARSKEDGDAGAARQKQPDRWRQMADEAKARVAARDSAQRAARRAASTKRVTDLVERGRQWLAQRFPSAAPVRFSPHDAPIIFPPLSSPHPPQQQSSEQQAASLGRVAVVGGGVAGLTAAFRLRQAGVDVTVYEAGQVGGSVRSYLEEGFFWEAGASILQVSVTANPCSASPVFWQAMGRCSNHVKDHGAEGANRESYR
jgi:hypothetical protein